MGKTIVEIKSAVPRMEHLQFDKPIDWKIEQDDFYVVIGPNGAGKTVLTDVLQGKYALKAGEVVALSVEDTPRQLNDVVKVVAFKDIYSLVDTNNTYYQQRWNKGGEQDMPIAGELVKSANQKWLQSLVEWFGIEDLMNKGINLLSSGELRKFLIIKALLTQPQVLVLDNPFIGLDVASRLVLNTLLSRLFELEGLQIVLVLSNPNEIPDMATKILPIKEKHLYPVMTREDFLSDMNLLEDLFPQPKDQDISKLKKLYPNESIEYRYAAVLKNIHVKYDDRTILHDLDWSVGRGEKWALLGPNGAGKSTLLSLICGDNPQAYANDITLFDRKRGTGESIWDIKKHIGYISPEMHLYYLKNVRSIDVVGSGFFDTIGLYRKCDSRQEAIALEWMKLFGIERIKEVSFLQISSGEQRLALLARLFVKNPELLILDEPLHGLDASNKRLVKRVIEEFCTKDKSLVYVTHYEHEIPAIVDKRLELKKI